MVHLCAGMLSEVLAPLNTKYLNLLDMSQNAFTGTEQSLNMTSIPCFTLVSDMQARYRTTYSRPRPCSR
jgi:hypothetical protein